MKRPELIAPAGNLEKLKIGVQYGADAFYLGLPVFSMRSRINNFTKESLMEGVKLIREAGKKFYVTCNVYPRGNKVDAFKHHFAYLRDQVKPDGIILADMGVLDIVKEVYPEAKIHVSVQANVLNYRAAKFWYENGAKRIVLPRELSLDEIKKIHDEMPDLELEFFVHGAICVSYSGRCLLSTYMTGRDANQGMCAHSCRWKYKVGQLEEEKRPGQFMPIEEDEHGTYIMNSRDMCLLPFLKDIVEAGITSFKIEGRNKTEHYLASIVKTYRQAIEDMMAGKEFDEELMLQVQKTANRGYIPGFLKGFPSDDNIYYEKNVPFATRKFVGIVKKAKVNGEKDLYEVEVRNRFEKGEEVEVMTPKDELRMIVEEIYDLEGEPVESVHGGAGNKLFRLKAGLEEGTILRKDS